MVGAMVQSTVNVLPDLWPHPEQATSTRELRA